MKRFIKKLALFLSPFLLGALLITAVDPFDYFNASRLIDEKVKRNTSNRINYVLSKLIDYQRNPAHNIILGDSRADSIDAAMLERATGKRFANLAYGGGTIPEIAATFWHVADNHPLGQVFIGVNFNLFNAYNSMNRVPEAISILNNPFLYLVNLSTLKALYYSVYAQYIDRGFKFAVPETDRDTFWQTQLGNVTRGFYYTYRYPNEYLDELQKISVYCRKNGIVLTFIIFPTHVDLQKKIDEYHLTEYRNRFVVDLSRLGRVVDMDYPNDFTSNRANFTDPYHFRKEAEQLILGEILGVTKAISRVYPLSGGNGNLPGASSGVKQSSGGTQ